MLRPTNDHERSTLKSICYRALRQIGAKDFAKDTRISEQQLSRYCKVVDEGDGKPDINFMPVDVVADLERVIGYPFISEHLAQLQGYIVVPGESGARPPTMDDVGALADSKGRLLSKLIRALLDGKVDNHESRDILPEIDETIGLLQSLRKNIQEGSR